MQQDSGGNKRIRRECRWHNWNRDSLVRRGLGRGKEQQQWQQQQQRQQASNRVQGRSQSRASRNSYKDGTPMATPVRLAKPANGRQRQRIGHAPGFLEHWHAPLSRRRYEYPTPPTPIRSSAVSQRRRSRKQPRIAAQHACTSKGENQRCRRFGHRASRRFAARTDHLGEMEASPPQVACRAYMKSDPPTRPRARFKMLIDEFANHLCRPGTALCRLTCS